MARTCIVENCVLVHDLTVIVVVLLLVLSFVRVS